MRFLMGVTFIMTTFGASAQTCSPLLNHQFKTLQGQNLNLCDYQGKPILVVNTASKCGFTPQFDKLEKLYSQYKSKGLLVIGFPSNDFKQELTTNSEIGSFCKLTYGVNFPMVSKGSVKGENATPFYKALIKASGTEPKWNFHKYVIAADGKSVQSFYSATEPDDAAILKLIVPHLK